MNWICQRGVRRLAMMAVVGAAVWVAACVPDPKSVKEMRDGYDRSPVKGYILGRRPAPKYALPAPALFGEAIRFLGFDYTPERPGRGDMVTMRFYLEVVKPVEENYQVFVHVDGEKRINADHWPLKKKYPMNVWRPGEFLVDEFKFNVFSSMEATVLDVYMGFYQGDDRMPLTNRNEVRNDGQNRLWAGQIRLD